MTEDGATEAVPVTYAPSDQVGKDKSNNVGDNTEQDVSEHLQLSPEESFFLSYGLGCLEVADEKGV